MKREYISLLTQTAGQKPNTVHDKTQSCPFCDRKTLIENNVVIDQEGSKLLIKNKFPVMHHCNPLVYIEHDTCDQNLTNYPEERLLDVLQYAIIHWLKMKNSGEYKDVLFFKNHGPLSGGSIQHAHMQIVGLYDQHPTSHISFDNLDGVVIQEEEGFHWSLSQTPFTEGHEFTIRMKNMKQMRVLAKSIQHTTHYILNHLNTKFQSYNLCFYHVKDEIIVKVLTRKPTSPLLLGYGLSQVPDNLEAIAKHIQTTYEI